MRLLIVADGRSPITKRWIQMLQPLGYEVYLVSTFPCPNVARARWRFSPFPVAFAKFAGSQAGGSTSKQHSGLITRFRGLAAAARHWLGPWTLPGYKQKFLEILDQVKPDIVHALRIPYEGMLASYTPPGIPLILSTWGNDLTLHAPSTPRMSALTRRALKRCDALMCDTERDLLLAREWGFDAGKPGLVVAGNGGIDLDEILSTTAGIKQVDPPQIINPRGIRSYVRNDTFFKAIPLVLQKHPEVRFVCTSMAGQPEAQKWVERLGIDQSVTLLPLLSQHELWQEFARSTISVSVSTHDGTPNTLLEAMSLGCLPNLWGS